MQTVRIYSATGSDITDSAALIEHQIGETQESQPTWEIESVSTVIHNGVAGDYWDTVLTTVLYRTEPAAMIGLVETIEASAIDTEIVDVLNKIATELRIIQKAVSKR